MRYPYGRITIVPRTGPRSTSSALKTTSLYQAEKSSLCGVTPRSSCATPRRIGDRGGRHTLVFAWAGPPSRAGSEHVRGLVPGADSLGHDDVALGVVGAQGHDLPIGRRVVPGPHLA